MFRDRSEAGRLLGEHLKHRLPARGAAVVVLGIPRGGVLLAAPVAAALGAPLDVVVPRKIGAPGEPELAVGAIALAEGEEIVILDDALIARLEVPVAYLQAEAARQRREIVRRVEAYREGRAAPVVAGRTALIVDDGIATGLTARAAAAAVSRLSPREVIVAAAVAPAETLLEFRRRGLRLEVLRTPEAFMAVGQFYRDFRAVEDDEVRAALRSNGLS